MDNKSLLLVKATLEKDKIEAIRLFSEMIEERKNLIVESLVSKVSSKLFEDYDIKELISESYKDVKEILKESDDYDDDNYPVDEDEYLNDLLDKHGFSEEPKNKKSKLGRKLGGETPDFDDIDGFIPDNPEDYTR